MIKRSKEEWTEKLIGSLYKHQFIQTLWNAEHEVNRKKGWTLVSGRKAIWYFNIRPVGDVPGIFHDICQSMADMITENNDINLLIGVEMAGVPLVGAIAEALFSKGRAQRIGYTRPTKAKGMTPIEAANLLKTIDAGVADYGQKEFVESRMKDGDKIAIVDDMATNLGSKIVARALVLWQAKRFGLKVNCDRIYYFLNRGLDNKENGLNFITESEPALYPARLYVNYIIEFDIALPLLKKVMAPSEYEMVKAYQLDPSQFQGDSELWQEAVRIAAYGK